MRGEPSLPREPWPDTFRPMRLLIVEDEPLIAHRIERFCRAILGDSLDHCSVAATFDEASARLAEQPIDLLLLDLNLNGRDGMELLRTSVAHSFHTIIVSANIEHALRAFEYGVLDFVPKPFTQERLTQALQRATDTTSRAVHGAKHLAVRKQGRVELVSVDDVAYIQGAGNYSELVLADGRRQLHDKTLEKLEAVLPPDFVRVHKSFLVRFGDIRALHAHEGGHYEAELKQGMRVPVGRTRYKELRAKLM
jgi:two-component system, LytTR family, response regulator LytT